MERVCGFIKEFNDSVIQTESLTRGGTGLPLNVFFFFPPLLISAERLTDTSLPMMPCEPAGGEGLAPKVPLSADTVRSDETSY